MSFSEILICKNLLENPKKIKWLEMLVATLVMCIPVLLFYGQTYNGLITLFTFILSIFIYHSLFQENFSTAFLLASFVMLLTALSDLAWSVIAKSFVDVVVARKVWYIMVFSNLGISVIAVLLSKIKLLQKLFQDLDKRLAKKVYFSTILFLVLFLGVVILLHSNMLEIFKSSEAYTISVCTLVIFFILYYIYVTDKINYDRLRDEYNSLFSCIQTFENWIDKEQLGLHEMKNNLSIIRGMTNNKNIQEKIDSILQESLVLEKDWVEQLKSVPKGGVKGLLYYKMAVARNKKVNMYVEVSPKISKKLKNMKQNTIKELCILLGIYLDNAIEAAEGTKKHQVTLEIYMHKDALQFVISNTFKERPDLDKIHQKGYTTKGLGHGRGLYFAGKTINKNEAFSSTQQILNDFYVQKLSVRID